MSAKHTPGPWVVKADEEIVYGTSHEGEHIVVVYELNTNEADARLIAAAPDLLEALQRCVDHLEYTELGRQAFTAAKAAIDRATGADQ